MTQTPNLYSGISFERYSYDKSLKLFDIELVKKDILNHIFTRRGERVKMLTYGTRIPDLVFEPMDDETLTYISEDIVNVFASDPRVEISDMRILPLYDNNVVIVSVTVLYVELDFTDRFDIKIDFQS